MRFVPDCIASLFGRRSPLEEAARELFDAKLAKLQSESAKEYAEALCSYNGNKIRRLERFLREEARADAGEEPEKRASAMIAASAAAASDSNSAQLR